MVGLSTRTIIRHIAVPTLVYTILFFGGSELLEHYLSGHVSVGAAHWLHIVRGVLSVSFVAGIIVYSLSRVETNYESQLQSICSLLSAAKQGIVAFDAGGQVLSVNHRAAELLGSTQSENFLLWGDEIRGQLRGQSQLECWNPAGDRRLRVVSLRSEEVAQLLLLQDVTDEKDNEEQWLIAEKLASVGRMAAGLAHEIGTPLNIISGRAELIQEMQSEACGDLHSRHNCPVEKHIQVIFQQIERITTIMQQLLTQAREPTHRKELFCVNQCVTRVSEFLQHLLERRNIRIQMELDANLPPVFGYGDQFQQVLINLVTNSMDATEGREGLIEISTGLVGSQVFLRVKDNGSGIPHEDLTKIFDPFFTTKEFGKGTGLGLTVTANIVHAHGGSIDVKSKQGYGTMVTIQLPAVPMAALTPAALPAAR